MAELADILRRIVEKTRERVAVDREQAPTLRLPKLDPAAATRFSDALRARRGRAIIAEVKMGSPRLGSLAGRVDPERQAEIYAAAGAAALSVVVEPDFFGGSYDLLRRCRVASGLPALAKDFVIDPIQIQWAYEAGASAVLLIAALLDPERLASLAVTARRLGLVPMVETHDREDIAKLGTGPWEVVGINNRDLRTFDVDIARSIELLPSLPRESLRVAESGLHAAADLARLRDAGFDAFLIGETLLLADDPRAKLQELLEG